MNSNSGIIPASWTPALQALLRVVTGLLFLEHGIAKLPSFLSLPPLIMLAAVLEVVGGVLFIAGAFTRYVAFILSGQMAIAYFMGHALAKGSFLPLENGGEAAILFCFIFLFFAAAGAGAYSLDNRKL